MKKFRRPSSSGCRRYSICFAKPPKDGDSKAKVPPRGGAIKGTKAWHIHAMSARPPGIFASAKLWLKEQRPFRPSEGGQIVILKLQRKEVIP